MAKNVQNQLKQSKEDKGLIESELKSLKDKKEILSKAVTPEWGTVHLFSVAVIEQIDHIENLISSANKRDNPNLTGSLEEIHNSLLAVLTNHNVELFYLKEKDQVLAEDKDKIEIIEGPKSTKKNPAVIQSIISPGYICMNGKKGKLTVLRKAKVKTLKAT